MSRNRKAVRVAVDAMGGDYAPQEIVKGAILALKEGGLEIGLVGAPDIIETELTKHDIHHLPLRSIRADEVIEEDEHPAFAVYRKPNASIVVATKMLKSGEADAVVSAGATGATVVSATQFVGTIKGMDRPTIGGPITGFAHDTVMMDCGANVDCRPHQLLSFAAVGVIYARKFFHIDNPKVALLNVGAEEGKGNELVRESYPLLQKSGLNFIGNIEGYDVLSGKANVIVCDGFVGNILSKFYESMGDYAGQWIRKKWKKYPLSDFGEKLINELSSLTKMSQEESMGGALLWGIDGVVMGMHGNSQAPQVAKMILKAKDVVNADVVGSLKVEMARISKVSQRR
jgi:glycerol-3-phosphate acyltransferase PlsX